MSTINVIREVGLTDFQETILAVLFILHSKREKFGFPEGWISREVFLDFVREAQGKELIPRFLEFPQAVAALKHKLLVPLERKGFLSELDDGRIHLTDEGLRTLPVSVLLPYERQMVPGTLSPGGGYFSHVPDIWKLGALADELAKSYPRRRLIAWVKERGTVSLTEVGQFVNAEGLKFGPGVLALDILKAEVNIEVDLGEGEVRDTTPLESSVEEKSSPRRVVIVRSQGNTVGG